ncbi:hypothetical protein LPJ66_010210, partial [Kickxella alabastrina]
TLVEFHFIIEECGERFGAEDLEQLVEIVAAALPRDDEEGEDADEEEEGDDEGAMDVEER